MPLLEVIDLDTAIQVLHLDSRKSRARHKHNLVAEVVRVIACHVFPG